MEEIDNRPENEIVAEVIANERKVQDKVEKEDK